MPWLAKQWLLEVVDPYRLYPTQENDCLANLAFYVHRGGALYSENEYALCRSMVIEGQGIIKFITNQISNDNISFLGNDVSLLYEF
jgi:hypothetical protein